MKRVVEAIVMSTAVLALVTAAIEAQDAPVKRAATSPQRDIHETWSVRPPEELLIGTATLGQVRAWAMAEVAYMFPGPTPTDPEALEITRQDLDLDGTPDLLLDTQRGGSGGVVYAAFLTTPQGFRYVGTFQGRLRALPVAPGERKSVLISTRLGGGQSVVQLAELQADGLHRVASATLSTGDSGTDEGNRLAAALFEAEVVSSEILRQVFGGYNFGPRAGAVQRSITFTGDSARTLTSLLASGSDALLEQLGREQRLVLRDLVVMRRATQKSSAIDPLFQLDLISASAIVGSGPDRTVIREASSLYFFFLAAKVPGGVSLQGSDFTIARVECSVVVRQSAEAPQRYSCTIALAF